MLASSVQSVVAYNATAPRVCTLVLFINVALQRCVQGYGRTTHSQLHLKLQVNGLLYIVASHSLGAIELQCTQSDLMPQVDTT